MYEASQIESPENETTKKLFIKLIHAIRLSERDSLYSQKLKDNLRKNTLKSIADDGVQYYLVFEEKEDIDIKRNIFYVSKRQLEFYILNQNSEIERHEFEQGEIVIYPLETSQFAKQITQRFARSDERRTLENPKTLDDIVKLYMIASSNYFPTTSIKQ